MSYRFFLSFGQLENLFDQFTHINPSMLVIRSKPKLKIDSVIGKTVWEQGGDIRDVISIGKLVRKNDVLKKLSRYLVR